MNELIKYIEYKLESAKRVIERNEKDAYRSAQIFYNQAFGALEYYCFTVYVGEPESERTAIKVWEIKYKKEFENLIYGT